MKYDLLVFIGRFQPLHLGHQEVIERALSLSKHVLVLVGSTGVARSARNPFTFVERRNMIKSIYPEVIVRGIHDHTYDDTAWITEVQRTVKEVIFSHSPDWGREDLKIGLIGCAKDHTSYYLKLFPEWGSESVEFVNPLNATDIRREIFRGFPEHELAAVMDTKTTRWITHEYKASAEFAKRKAEQEYLKGYKEKYGEGPFLTADSLVQVGGNILLITRGKEYGHGLLALPGGFVNPGERFIEAALRELKEETRLKVPKPVLLGSVKANFLADAPHRSERGRIVSVVQYIRLENETSLPEVRGGDDADKAEWHAIADLREEDFFEDHYHIIKAML